MSGLFGGGAHAPVQDNSSQISLMNQQLIEMRKQNEALRRQGQEDAKSAQAIQKQADDAMVKDAQGQVEKKDRETRKTLGTRQLLYKNLYRWMLQGENSTDNLDGEFSLLRYNRGGNRYKKAK